MVALPATYAPFVGRKGRERSERGMQGEGKGPANQTTANPHLTYLIHMY